MSNRYDRLKENKNNKATAWVYDRHYGWINVNQYLQDIKKMLKCFDKKLKRPVNGCVPVSWVCPNLEQVCQKRSF